MDINKDPLNPETDDKLINDEVSAKNKTDDSNNASEAAVFTTTDAQAKQKEEYSMEENLEELEQKIISNMEQLKKVDAKIKETEEEIEEIEEKKEQETISDKVKKIALICPKMCVEANVCRFPKALCKGCRKMTDVCISAGETGIKAFSELTVKCFDSLSTSMRLQLIRRKINKDFKKLGDHAYNMYLKGDKDILENADVVKIIDELKGYEKQIEELETHLANIKEKPITINQNA